MKSRILFFMLLAVALTFNACSDSSSASADDTLKSIPNSVSMLTAIDTDAILEKADFENVKQMEFYQELVNETKRYNSTLAEVIADPTQSGIDLSKNIYIAHDLDPDNPEEAFVAIVATVKDKAALEKLINSNTSLKKSSQDNFEVAMKGSQSVAWNAEKVVLGMTNSYSDPIDNIKSFFNTTADQSVASDSNLKKAFSGNHDISSWITSNAMAQSPTLKNALVMASIDPEAAKDNFIHSSVDFKNGAIASRSDMYLQDALIEDVNLMFKDKVSTDFSSYIPADANSAMAVSLDFEGIQSVLQKKGMLMMANFGLQEYGLTVEDIASTFGGDILLYSTPGQTEAPYGSFATTINDQEKLGKFISLASDFNFLKKEGENLYSIPGTSIISGEGFNGQDAQLLIQDDMIFLSADAAIVSKISGGGYSGSEKMDKSKVKSLRNHIFSGFVDYTSIIMGNKINEKPDLNLDFKEMNFATDRKNSTLNVNFKDKKANGLKQLFETINKLYLADKNGTI